MYAVLNSSIKLRDLIQGVIVQSGNDACIAIAEGMGGTEETFAQNMTLRARELGLKKSTFMNATGLPHPKHKTTARELALIARHIIYNLSEYYHYYSQQEFTWNKITQKNRNPLLYQNIGADGLKTGFIRESGYGLVASAKRKGQRLILVINGMTSSRKRSSEARKLLDWGFRAFKPTTVFKANERVAHASVWGGTKPYIKLVSKEPISVLLTKEQRKNIKAEIVYQGPLQAPIKKGAQVAKLRLTAKGGITNELPLYAGEDIKRGGLWARAFSALVFLALGG
jgi:D-alanyl-D-alanine carboxypeptidase (penicillin-binding protein 5/6)